MKICTRCKEDKELSQFGKSGTRFSSWCKSCHSEYYRLNRDRHKKSMILWEKRRNKELRDIVINRMIDGCIDCGQKNILTLEFDHKDGKEKREHSIAKLMNSRCSPERLIQELDKCEVRCANCHRIKTSYETWNSWRLEYLTER